MTTELADQKEVGDKPSADEIAQEIVAHMRKRNLTVVTMTWKALYELTARSRVTEPLLKNIEEALKRYSILMVRGVAILAFVNDYDFAPWQPAETPTSS